MKKLYSLIRRHAQVFRYVLTNIVPPILRTGRRPVIFSKYSGIGDVICTFPAALELKKRHTGTVIIYNCHADFSCLPRLARIADLITNEASIGLVGYWYRFLLGGFYQFASDDDNPRAIPTDVYIKDFGRPFGLTLPDAHPPLRSDPGVVERVRSILNRKAVSEGSLILIHTGPSWPVREWPTESWTALVAELKHNGFANIVQIGTRSHLTLGVVSGGPISGTLSLLDLLTLEESIALMAQCNLFIGIDSGMLHIAAAIGIPSVGLWGPTSPQFRFSSTNRRSFITSTVECQGCHHRYPRLHWITGCPHEIRCMKTITVIEVLSACLKRLESPTIK